MLVFNSPQVVQETALVWKREGKISLVPTMGCLHEGHLALVRLARQYGTRVIVSLFVNPLQFGPNEDFARYPRTREADEALLKAAGVDLLFAPEPRDLYPPGFATKIQVEGLDRFLCGASRPGHFSGVATVCLKLFQICQPDFAVFGEKDFQQLRILERLAVDLNLPLAILRHPTVREADGLAMSSRNRYLSQEERRRAAAVPRALLDAKRVARSGSATVGDVLGTVSAGLARAGGEIDYAAVASEHDLVPAPDSAPVASIPSPHLFVAVKIGGTRLIDNTALDGEGL